MTTDHLTAADVESIRAAVEFGVDNYDGRSLELDIAQALIDSGWTAPDCDDDEHALGEIVMECMPDPHASHYWPADRLVRETTDQLVHASVRLEAVSA